jgi:hypothetical protein
LTGPGGKVSVISGAATAETTKIACDLVAAAVPLVFEDGGWPAVCGFSSSMLLKAQMHQAGVCSGAVGVGLASAIANAFPTMTPRELRQFLQAIEQEVFDQLLAARDDLRTMEPSGEA